MRKLYCLVSVLVEDLNFVNFIDPAHVQALFGNSTDTVISQIETSTVVPTIPIGPNKSTVDRRKISPKKERWDDPLSPRKEPPRYTLFRNQTYMERRGENEDHDEVRRRGREESN